MKTAEEEVMRLKNDGVNSILVGTSKWEIYEKIVDQPKINLEEWK